MRNIIVILLVLVFAGCSKSNCCLDNKCCMCGCSETGVCNCEDCLINN